MTYTFTREDVDIYSNGTRCSAWLYLPETDKKCPIIVMAYGLGGTREMRLYAFAKRFAQAGYACFLFDYRNYGASDANKRQLINVKMQLHDSATRTSKPPSAPTAIFTPNSTTSLQTCSPN